MKQPHRFVFCSHNVLSACLLLFSFWLSAAELKLASGGKALFKIALPEQQNKFDVFAAEDLQSYLGRMADASFQIVKEAELAPGEAAIYLGQTQAAKKLGLSAESFAREEWCIKCDGDNSLIFTKASR